MKLYLLDTDHFSLFERGHQQVVDHFIQLPAHEIGITIITAEEKIRGRLAYLRSLLSKPGRLEEQLQAYRWLRETIETVRDFSILDFDAHAHAIYHNLRQQKLRVGSQDLRSAAIVLSVNGILVTRNASDFSQIPGLLFEDWTK